MLSLMGVSLLGQDMVPKGTAEFRWTFVNCWSCLTPPPGWKWSL